MNGSWPANVDTIWFISNRLEYVKDKKWTKISYPEDWRLEWRINFYG